MLLGDSVDVGAQAERQLRHVEGCPAARRFLQVQKILFRLQNTFHQIRRGSVLQIEEPSLARKHAREIFHRKTVVPRGHRSMGGEDALAADPFNVLAADGFASLFCGFFVEQLQREQRRVAFVHVVAGEVVVAKGVENADASDSQDDFLAQTVVRIAAVQTASEITIGFGVGREIGVEKIDGHFKPTHTFCGITPAAQLNTAAFNGHTCARGILGQEVSHAPFDRLFRLRAVFGKTLREVSFAVKQRNGHHGQTQIRCGANCVTRKNAQPPAVGWHGVLQGNFHGEVSDQSLRGIQLTCHFTRFSFPRGQPLPCGKSRIYKP